MNIPLSSPEITDSDIEAVTAVLRTPQLSLGPKLSEFERAFARYIGVPHGVALSSGTAGLQLGLEALGIGEGDEVIVPSFTFIAAANAIRHARATPVFADIDPLSLNLTAASIEHVVNSKTRAILLVHTFGVPADLNPILVLAQKHNLEVIEDACEAVGSEYRGAKVGGFGDLGVFSFYPNKPITTGEGGMVVTRDPALAKKLRALRNQGRMESDGWLQHSILGYNCRLSELSCALGISQLKKIDGILARREQVANRYCEVLAANPDITLPPRTVVNGRVSWFAFVVRLSSRFDRTARDRAADYLTASGIGCRAYFPPIHLQPIYSENASGRRSLPVTEKVAERTLALPFFNTLQNDQILNVCRTLNSALLSSSA